MIKENLNKSFDFRCFSLRIECQELSDRSLEFRRFYDFTPSGRWLARVVVPKIAEYVKFVHEQKQNEINRFYRFYGDIYNESRNGAESIIMPTAEKKRLAIGQIVHFLIENDAAVGVRKTIYVKEGRFSLHKSGYVLKIRSEKNKKVKFEKLTRGPHWKALSHWERDFVNEIIAYIEANDGLFHIFK